MYLLANSEDLDELTHFIRVHTVCYIYKKRDPLKKKCKNNASKMKKPVNSLSASVNQNQFWIKIRLDVSRIQFGSRSGPAHIGPDLDPKCLVLKVFLIFFVIFLKKVTPR